MFKIEEYFKNEKKVIYASNLTGAKEMAMALLKYEHNLLCVKLYDENNVDITRRYIRTKRNRLV